MSVRFWKCDCCDVVLAKDLGNPDPGFSCPLCRLRSCDRGHMTEVTRELFSRYCGVSEMSPDEAAALMRQVDDLRDQVTDLEHWKASAIKVLNEIDLQEAGRILGLPIATDVAKEIVPALRELAELRKGAPPSPRDVPGGLLTGQERKLLQLLWSAWKEALALPVQNHDDMTEFRHGLHALQYLVMKRAAFRSDGA